MVLTFKAVAGPMKGHLYLVRVNSTNKFAIGRSKNSSICVYDDPFASRNHAKIYAESEGVMVEDNDSKNGTYLNGNKVRKKTKLSVGEKIIIGKTVLLYKGSMNHG